MKLRNETISEVVDPKTGEVSRLVQSKEYSTRISPDQFYMTFIDYISPVFRLKSENARKLLTWMCCHAEYNTGIVNITSKDRKEMSEELGFAPTTITNNLAKLRDLGLITGDSGRFQLNPMIFWKGDARVRERILKDGEFKITMSFE